MKKTQSGFTLIEIAIVLVIIGLLLGGVLKGQELINSAKVRSFTNKVDGITASWFAFQDRYRAIPGDMSNAATQIKSTLTNGGGNGRINTDTERGQVWAHLSAAGFVSGKYSGDGVGNTYNCDTAICPENGFGQGMLISYGNRGTGNTGSANEMISGRSIPVGIIAEVDLKVDDGDPTEGTMRLSSAGAFSSCATGTDYNVTGKNTDCAVIFRNF